jgi:malonyl-CoA/methylmalonyl-CoA synthetase
VSDGFSARVEESLARHAGRTALEARGAPWTFATLAATAARIAAGLAAHGARPGDRVAACVERSPYAVALWLACLRGGFVHVPLNPALTRAEIGYFLGDAGPRVVVLDPAGALARGDARVLTLDARGAGTLTARASAAPPVDAHPSTADDLALLLYTSGTTGKPKGAMLTQGNLASNVLTLRELWRFTSDDVLLHVLPLSHVHGLVVALGCALASGCTVRFFDRFDPAAVVREMATATVFMGVPTHYTRLLAEPALDRAACASMRLFVSGSAPLSAQAFAQFEARSRHRILERYGMTETLMIASNPYDGERTPGCVGEALPGVELRIRDDSGRPVARGEAGILEVRGPNVCKGYWQAPEKTAGAFREDGWFVTGDIGRLDEEERLWLEGRASDLIITGGYNVYPREVEDALLAVDGVAEAAVFGVAHPLWGEAVVATLCGEGRLDEARILAALRERLAAYKLPKRILQVDALPRNAMGKVQKQALRTEHAGLFAGIGDGGGG